MKKFLFIAVLLVAIAVFAFLSCQQNEPDPEKLIAKTLMAQVDSFSITCNTLKAEAEKRSVDAKQLQQLFLQMRLAYKGFEWAAEYFEPATSRFVNGPPVQEIELSGQVFQPAGLQVLEGFLFPSYDTTKQTELMKQLSLLQSKCNIYRSHFASVDILDWQVFDAVKLEVFRIETLGITGFDDPLTLKSMTESATALKSLQNVMSSYDKENTDALYLKFEATKKYLVTNTDFNLFNRADFIGTYCNPLTTEITDLEKKLKINVTWYNRLLNQDAKTLFDTNAFNVNAYSPDQSSFVTNEKIALGEKLFSDPILSGHNMRSCRSCHQPDKAFTDGLIKNTIISSDKMLARNTPTLINAALQAAQFYDMRVNTLEDQSHDVVQSTVEMRGSIKASVQKLWNDSTYRRMFSTAFPEKNRNSIDTLEIMNAIGSYVRSLTLLNSRFDEYMRGNKTALSADEINGFNLFMGKAKCATCHYMPLFNGTFPPRYMKTEAEVIGVPQTTSGKEIDSDPGRYNIVKIESLKHAFKTPTVRNAARTSPYMHNGVFITLQQVMDFYNRGGGNGLGLKVDNQTLPFDKLDLTPKEGDDIIAFIKSLDSR
jgi:cytochrome c peroxidase